MKVKPYTNNKTHAKLIKQTVYTPYITYFRYPLIARVALVKCRDLHWAMMAHKDQRDTNLSSIRMLIVADGANPCESLHLHKHALLVKRTTVYRHVFDCFYPVLVTFLSMFVIRVCVVV